MSSNEIAVLTESRACRHIVYPYTDEGKAVRAVHLFANSGLSKGESVILIMSDSHCEPISGSLRNEGHNVGALQASGQLVCISADSLLKELTRNGALDETLFTETANRVVDRAKAASPAGKVRVFGEMVSLLLARGDVASAERLEGLWNEIIETRSISLLCTYTLLASGHSILPASLANLHTHDLSSWNGAVGA